MSNNTATKASLEEKYNDYEKLQSPKPPDKLGISRAWYGLARDLA